MKPIYKSIRTAFSLFQLQDNWDVEGAKQLSPEVFNKAMIFVFQLLEKTGSDMIAPSINLCCNDSIDFSFRDRFEDNPGGYIRLLINVNKNGFSYYGTVIDSGEEINKACHDFNVDIELINWIKVNLMEK